MPPLIYDFVNIRRRMDRGPNLHPHPAPITDPGHGFSIGQTQMPPHPCYSDGRTMCHCAPHTPCNRQGQPAPPRNII
jgi:hypothetical protein